ncbi:LOW QUALITY PROTEIN: uncharacterized protein [Atheta coriaria]|uniref:LOW QUALITY PROTEIN: uncharacterized protein n=1 Tax=Dalotia coriaria TaxID=877792 RepID=UPI0031F4216F
MEFKDEEEYLLLGFKDPVEQKFFNKPNLFFKIVNLHTKTPYIQIGNHVFRAKVDEESLGTSLIFEEQDELAPPNIYDKETHINLKYIAKTCRFLALQWCKIPDEVPEIQPSELIELEFRHSYDTVMKQLEDGHLDINDIIKKPEGEGIHLTKLTKTLRRKRMFQNHPQYRLHLMTLQKLKEEQADTSKTQLPETENEESYSLLKDMVHKQSCDPEYYNILKGDEFNNDKEFKILKEIYLKSFDYEKFASNVSKSSMWEYVDLQGSIDDGIIEMKDKLNADDKKKLFDMGNFDNFTLDLKIIVLSDYLKGQKEIMKNKSKLELLEEDEYGRTIKKRYKMVKSLVKDLKYNLFVRSLNTVK